MAIIVPQNLVRRNSDGSEYRMNGSFQYGLYETGGSLIRAKDVGLVEIKAFECDQAGGFTFDPQLLPNGTGVLVKGYAAGGGVASGTNSMDSGGTPSGVLDLVSAGTPTGTNSEPVLEIVEDQVLAVVADFVGFPGPHLPANIQNVYVTASGVGPFIAKIQPATEPLIPGSVGVSLTGFMGMVFFGGDAVTAIKVTYVTKIASAPVFIGDPLGTHTHIFTGDPLANHTHIFTGNPFGGSAEIANGTDLSSLGNIAFEATGL